MLTIGVLLGGLVVLWATLYTVNFGRWAWQQGARKGAIGLWLLALAVFLVPLWVYIRGSAG
ncbi:MAG: hypothetical protein ACYC5Y_13775 [Symbiobacteriia bacterium]